MLKPVVKVIDFISNITRKVFSVVSLDFDEISNFFVRNIPAKSHIQGFKDIRKSFKGR